MTGNLFRTLGAPPDVPSMAALAAALLLLWQGRRIFSALYRAPKQVCITGKPPNIINQTSQSLP